MLDKITSRDLRVSLGDLVLPRHCVVCGGKLSLRERCICLSCLADLPRTRFSNISHNQLADRFNALIQRNLDLSGGTEEYSYASALFFYRSSTGYRKITQRLKYHADFAVGRYFSRMLGSEMADSPLYSDVDTVIPVPLHWTRRWRRGYNQAEVIAGEIAACLGAELRPEFLFRKRRTRSQTKVGVAGKEGNVARAFQVRKGVVPTGHSHILLVDDVFTTGATLHACYLALRKVFPPPVRISVATLAAVGM